MQKSGREGVARKGAMGSSSCRLRAWRGKCWGTGDLISGLSLIKRVNGVSDGLDAGFAVAPDVPIIQVAEGLLGVEHALFFGELTQERCGGACVRRDADALLGLYSPSGFITACRSRFRSPARFRKELSAAYLFFVPMSLRGSISSKPAGSSVSWWSV